MTENKVEVIVVGAGPAGTTAAITLARAGKKVLLVDTNSRNISKVLGISTN